MKHIPLIIFLTVLFVFSCNSPQKTNSNSSLENSVSDSIVSGVSLDSIISNGKLIAILNNTPTSYFIHRGQPMGYQYELLTAFTKELGVELEVKMVASIPDALDSLEQGKAHIVASGLTVLGERKKRVDFSLPIIRTKQVLIQRLPENAKKLSSKKLKNQLITDVTQLAKKTVHVEEGSSYLDRMINLQEEIGDSINIVTYGGEIDIEKIMDQISAGEIDYAITEKYMAQFFIKFYDNLDISTAVSLNQNIAWAVPKSSDELLYTINNWIKTKEDGLFWAVLYDKYFKHNKQVSKQIESDFTLANGKISPFDKLIKKYAENIGWDWLLLAAQIRTESKFDPNSRSWVGAEGLMQIMPTTAKEIMGSHPNLLNPETNIKTGTTYDQLLFDYWIQQIPDSMQALKFTLASYNIGKGHVFDAQRLAEKHGFNPQIWDDNVELMMLKLSNSKFYRDPVVRHGYCRGKEAYDYVKKIFLLYSTYLDYFNAIK